MGNMVRLDRFLAEAGKGTRSEVKKYIRKGLVQINGRTEKCPETKIRIPEDQVFFNGELTECTPEFEYFILNKPAGYVSATEDTKDHTVMELIPSDRRGLFPVGRLDKDTEGLLLITDDGQLAHQLLSPAKHVDKTYYVVVDGRVTKEDAAALERGVDIGEEKPTLPARTEILSLVPDPDQTESGLRSEIHLTIHEGKFHQVKRMMEAVGKKVMYLKRISMGSLTLPQDLPTGACRPLTEQEISSLKKR